MRVFHDLKMGLKGAFLLASVVMVAVSTAAVHFPWSYISRESVEDLGQQLNNLVAVSVSDEIRNVIETTETAQIALFQLAKSGVLDLADKPRRDAALLAFVRSQPHFSFVSVGLPNGDFLGAQRVNPTEFRVIESRYDASNKTAKRIEDIYLGRDADKPTRTDTRTNDFFSPTRSWYRAAIDKPGLVWTPIFVFANTGKAGLNSAIAVRDANGLKMVLSVAIELDRITAYLNGLGNLRNGTAFVLDRSGKVISARERSPSLAVPPGATELVAIDKHPDPLVQLAGATAAVHDVKFATIAEGRQVIYTDPQTQRTYFIVYRPDASRDWIVATIIPAADFLSGIDAYRATLALLIGAAVLASLLLALAMATWFTAGFRRCVAVMTRIADGDLATSIPPPGWVREVSALTNALIVFRDNGLRVAELKEEQARLDSQMEARQRSERLKLAEDFEQSVKSVADRVGDASADIHAAADHSAKAQSTATGNAMEVASSTEEILDQARTVADRVDALRQSTEKIAAQVSSSQSAMASAVSSVDATTTQITQLAETARQISDFVALISEIAAQTNLLALNATIEAARAGDAGRGFAVVAQEVKNLSTQTERATSDISQLVASIQGETSAAVEAVRSARGAIDHMDKVNGEISAAVSQQNDATSAAARDVGALANELIAVKEAVASIARDSIVSTSNVISILWSADDLDGANGKLQVDLTQFITQIKR
jgi:methyl-accepting chemotaxis protein